MSKIKRLLIHLLGGMEKQEYSDSLRKKYNEGMRDMADSIHSEMKRIYGVPANEWTAHMYVSVSMRLEEYKVKASSC